MSDKVKAIVFGIIAGFALGGLVGGATFGGWGGLVGSVLGVVIGGGTMAMLAGAALSMPDGETPPDDTTEAEVKP